MVENYLVNPYTPGAGKMPKYLAGRKQILEEAFKLIAAIAYGFTARSVIYYGLRGVGKTVLLNEIEKMADEKNIRYEHIEIAEQYSFKRIIALAINKLMRKISAKENIRQHAEKALSVLKAFQITYGQDGDVSLGIDPDILKAEGIADTGDFQNDLTELLLSLGALAEKANIGTILFIDEIQYLRDDEFAALISAIHRIEQKGYPVVIFAAGLPKIAKIAGDIKSYAERLFQFIQIDSLTEQAAELALSEPAKKLGVTYHQEALAYIVNITEGYPYFLQEYGRQVWDFVNSEKEITLDAAQQAYDKFIEQLDNGFFKVRHDRATAKELEFMKAMVKCGSLPCSTNQIAHEMGRTPPNISPPRAQLIHKGFIYATSRCEVDFTVPQFDQYLKRLYSI